MKAQWGDSIQVRYDLWVEGSAVRSNAESEIMLRPGPTATALVYSLIGFTLDEERTVEIPASFQWELGHYPVDIPEGSKLTYRFRLLKIMRNALGSVHASGGSLAERMRQVDSTLAERYRQRSGES